MELSNLCEICIEELIPNDTVCCPHCSHVYCETCFQKSLIMEMRVPICIFCKSPFSMEFTLRNNATGWLKNVFIPFLGDLYFQRELTLIPTAIPEFKKLLQIRKLRHTRKELPTNRELKMIYSDVHEYEHAVHNKNILRDSLSNQIFELEEGNTEKYIEKKYILPCSKDGCRGFVDNTYCCEICETKICRECYEIKERGHVCNRESLESANMIKTSTKPCPKCFVPIIKASGCDQMFCTNCNTAFYYSTLEIVKGHIHNPHYFEWLATRGEEENQDNMACGDVTTLFNSFQRKNRVGAREIHYLVVKIITIQDEFIDRVQPYDELSRNMDIRVKILDNDIDEKKIKKLLVSRELLKLFNEDLRKLFEMAIIVLADIFRRVVYGEMSIDDSHEQVQEFLIYNEDCLNLLCDTYGKKISDRMFIILTTFENN